MFKNYLVTAFRSLWKNRGFSLINIFGLLMGITASLTILVFIKDERSYDKHHKNASNIFRIVKDFINDDGSRIPDATTPAALMPAMLKEVPEVAAITRLRPNWGGTYLIKYGDRKFSEERLYGVDTGFFDVFTFPFVSGDPKNAFRHANSILLTESMAAKYFGKADPVGKVLDVDAHGQLTVTGVVQDVPPNSHFHFDFLVSFAKQPGDPTLENNWDGYNDYTYVRLMPGTNLAQVEQKIQSINDRNVEKSFSDFYLQPLTGIHLNSHLKWELEPNSDGQHVYVFTIIALFVILIGCINYINLTTARASVRAKEIGVRKVIGALRSSLVQQFLIETVIICLIASILAIALAHVLLPAINELTGKQLQLFSDPMLLWYILAGIVILGLLAGLLPALYLSSFKPIAVLKGLKFNDRGGLSLRKILVVVQFTISIVLIAGAIIVTRQMRYLTNAKLGMNIDQVAVIQNVGTLSNSDSKSFLEELRSVPGAKQVASANGMLPNRFNTTRVSVKGSSEEQQVNFFAVNYDYLDVLDIEIIEGRGFSSTLQSDTLNNGIPGGPLEQVIGSAVVNETALKDLGLKSPVIGKQLLWAQEKDTSYYMTIVGVAKDFHFTSLRTPIKPFVFLTHPNAFDNIVVKLDPSKISSTIPMLEARWKKYSTDRSFSYSFIDENFAQLYGAERRFQKVFTAMVILGIIIASLGLLGLATFAAEQRVKEIGIRKVLGASVMNVVQLLSRDFMKLIIIAFVIALPVAWYAVNLWLEDFAYRIPVSWWVFPVAGLTATTIALLTISFQSIKAARANPVKNLRTE
jgi:putative ABC transport system permease protein